MKRQTSSKKSSRAMAGADRQIHCASLRSLFPSAIRTEPVCFDLVFNDALGPEHWRHADHHIAAKAARNDISHRCTAAGYRYWPVVHLSTVGGTAKGADAAFLNPQ